MRKTVSIMVALILFASLIFTGCESKNTGNSSGVVNNALNSGDNIDGGELNQVTNNEEQKPHIVTGTNVCEYEDYIFYRNTNDNGSLYRYNTKDDSYIRLFDKNFNAFLHSISVYDNYVYFVTRAESDITPTLYKVHIDGGEAERLFDNVGDDYIITEKAIYYTDAVCDEGNIFGLHKYTFSDKSDILLNAYENNNLILKGNKLFYKRRNLAEQNKCTFESLDIATGAIEEISTENIVEICYVTTLVESNIIFFAAYYADHKMQLACYDINTGEYEVLSEKFYVIDGVAAVADDLVYFQAFTKPRSSEGFYESCTVYEWKNGKVDVYTDLDGSELHSIETFDGKPVLFANGNSGGEKILGDDRLNVVMEGEKHTDNSSNITIEETNNKKSFKDDAAVKAEIAKYVDTNIDFRLNKQEIVNKRVFNLVFSEIDKNHEKVIYKNEDGDIFNFDAKNGKLCEATIDSFVTQKTEESIDKSTAQKVVEEYAKTKYEINAYKVYSYKETTKGHSFIYTRYVGGYPSVDKFSVKIGYDGNVVYINDFTDVFKGKEPNYSKEFIDAKIKEYSDESKVDWNSITICVDDGKIAVSYILPENHAEMILPLE